jgi:hypothetical protein
MPKTQLILILHMVALVGCSHKSPAAKVQALPSVSTLPPPVLTALDRPVILIYEDIYNDLPPLRPQYHLDTVVWADGRIIWRAGDSLLRGKIDTRKIDGLIQRLHREGVFGDGKGYYGEFPPDSSFMVIKVRLADRQLELCSRNDGLEQTTRTVFTSQGMESLDGRDRDAVLAAQPPEWKRFRSVWSDIRSTVRSWIPPKGEPFMESMQLDFKD